MESFLKVPHCPQTHGELQPKPCSCQVPKGEPCWGCFSPWGQELKKIPWVALGTGVLAAKYMAVVPRQVTGMQYLHAVLGPIITRVFEEKKYVELDPSKVEIKDVG